MDLRQMRYFVTLAETLSFRRAAEKLNIAQPPLSVAIRKMEEDIGVRLFDRRNRLVTLTEAGRAALPEARRCLQQAQETIRVARAAGTGETGRIRLAFAGSATYNLLPKLLPAYRARHPKVKLELREGTNSQIRRMLESGEIDLGLVRTPTIFPSDMELVTIENDLLIAALPAGHPLARKSRLLLADLGGEPFVNHAVSGDTPGLHAATIAVFAAAGLKPDITQEAVQVHTIISLVASGIGVALVPSVSARHASDKITFRKLEDLPPAGTIGIALAYQPDRETSAAKRFREIAADLARSSMSV